MNSFDRAVAPWLCAAMLACGSGSLRSTPPTPPLLVTAMPGIRSASMSWTAPESDGGSPITGYVIVIQPATLSAVIAVAGTAADVMGLADGATYTFTVAATNAAGASAPSAPSNAVTIPHVTPAPSLDPIASPTYVDPIVVTGSATARATVRVKVDGVTAAAVVAEGTGRYSVDVPRPAMGSHVFTATAQRGATLESLASAARVVAIEPRRTATPVLDAIATPTRKDPITGVAHGTPGATARVNVDGVTRQVGTFAPDGEFPLSLGSDVAGDGLISIAVTAQSPEELESASSVERLVLVDRTAPARPVITSPEAAATTLPATDVVVTAETGGICLVSVDGTAYATTAGPDGTYTAAALPLAVGANAITAAVTDAAGNTSPWSATVTLTRSPPDSVTITSPADGATVYSPAAFAGSSTARGGTVVLRLDRVEEVTTTSDGFGNWTMTWSLPGGAHTVEGRVGTGSWSAPRSFTISAIAAEAVDVARSIVLRASMRARFMLNGAESVAHCGPNAGWNTPYLWTSTALLDFRMSPGYFDAAHVTAAVETIAATIGLDPASPAMPSLSIDRQGRVSFKNFGKTASYSNAGWFALFVVQAYRLGNTAVFDAYKGAALAALDGIPRDPGGSGAHWVPYDAADPSDDSQACSEFDWTDVVLAKGRVGASTALSALAYKELGAIATERGDPSTAAHCATRLLELKAGLASLRRADGFYDHDSVENAVPSAWITALVVSQGLCQDEDEEMASAVALRDAYLAGTISCRGGVRSLVQPSYYGRMIPWFGGTFPQDLQVNGGYWFGWWARFLYEAIAKVDGPRARALMEEQVETMLWMHRARIVEEVAINDGPAIPVGSHRTAPWEHISHPAHRPTTPLDEMMAGANHYRGYGLVGFSGAAILDAQDASPSTLVLTLDATNGYVATLPVKGHRTMGLSLAATQAADCTVRVSGRARLSSEDDPLVPLDAFGSWTTIADLALHGAAAVLAIGEIAPDESVFGGELKAEIVAGSGAGTITVTLAQGGSVTVEPDPAAGTGDSFESDRLATDYTLLGSGWSVDTGRRELRFAGTTNNALALLTSQELVDQSVSVQIRPTVGAQRYPGIALRMSADGNDGIVVVAGTEAQTTLGVYEVIGGVWAQLGGEISTGLRPEYEWGTLGATVVGSTVTVSMNGATVGTRTTTKLTAGRAGARVGHWSGSEVLGWRNLVVRPAGGPARPPQPIPPGYVAEWGLKDADATNGPRGTGLVLGEEASLPMVGVVNLRDKTGALVGSAPAPVKFTY